MKIKNILLGIFSLITFATYAQTKKSLKVETKTAVTELKVETDNLNELKNFDWKMVKEMFLGNDAEQEITLTFEFVNKSKIDKSKVRVDNFKVKLTGKTGDLDKMTAQLNKSFGKLHEIDGLNNKN